METVLFGGFFGLLLIGLALPLMMIGAVLVVIYEWEKPFRDVPWPWLFLLVPLWIVLQLWEGIKGNA